jgi:23S rRNA (uracil1939-C5)-methyltransferase
MTNPIIGLAAKGDGVTADGTFVPGAVPGDTLNDDGSITAGPHRQTAPCAHYGRCGGCQLQHVNDATYSAFITDRITSALSTQGLELPAIACPHLSPTGSRRRVALRALKSGRLATIGFAEGRSHTLVNLSMCPVMDSHCAA